MVMLVMLKASPNVSHDDIEQRSPGNLETTKLSIKMYRSPTEISNINLVSMINNEAHELDNTNLIT